MCTNSDRSCMDTISIVGGKVQDTSACLRGDLLSPLWLVKYVSVEYSKCGRTNMMKIGGNKRRDLRAILGASLTLLTRTQTSPSGPHPVNLSPPDFFVRPHRAGLRGHTRR